MFRPMVPFLFLVYFLQPACSTEKKFNGTSDDTPTCVEGESGEDCESPCATSGSTVQEGEYSTKGCSEEDPGQNGDGPSEGDDDSPEQNNDDKPNQNDGGEHGDKPGQND